MNIEEYLHVLDEQTGTFAHSCFQEPHIVAKSHRTELWGGNEDSGNARRMTYAATEPGPRNDEHLVGPPTGDAGAELFH